MGLGGVPPLGGGIRPLFSSVEWYLVCHLGSSVDLKALAHNYICLLSLFVRNAMDQSNLIGRKASKRGV